MIPFRNYIQLGEHHYCEHFGLDFEEFELGQVFHHRPGITLSQQDNAEEALDTINNAQLHYDAHYASQTEWKHCLGVSTLTLQKLIGMTSKTFGRKQRIIEFADIAMTHPVYGGDTLYAQSEIKSKSEYSNDKNVGALTVITKGFNQNKAEVASIEYTMLIYKSGKHPDDGQSIKPKDAKFASHRPLDDGSYMEQVGLYFEELDVGERYEHRPGKTLSAEENRIHALRSLELNPQYSDGYYNQTHQLPGLLIAEPFLVGVLTALTTRTFDRVVANLGWNAIHLLEPVYAGDTIYAASEILDKRESHSRPTQGIMHVKSEAVSFRQACVT